MRKNIFAHIPELLMDFPIGIPQNAKAETLQKGVPLSVLREHFRFKMLRTVKLNDKLGGRPQRQEHRQKGVRRMQFIGESVDSE